MSHVYEMRLYSVAPGKMDALLARFANHTDALFARYGIRTKGFWVSRESPKNLLIYMVEHDSVESAEKNWDAFRADKDWQRIKAETDADVPLVSSIERYFLDPVDLAAFRSGVSSKA